jgi:hypothetical protein
MPMPKAAGKAFGGEMLSFASTAKVELPSPSGGFSQGEHFSKARSDGGALPLWPTASPISNWNP